MTRERTQESLRLDRQGWAGWHLKMARLAESAGDENPARSVYIASTRQF
jgi:hypothetical protein